MASVSTLIGLGMSPALAAAISAGTIGTVAAAGSSATDATVINTDCCYVTAADGTKGVKLFDCEIGSEVTVVNHAGSALKVYPPSGQQLNLLTATTGNISVGANKAAICKKMAASSGGGLWACVYS